MKAFLFIATFIGISAQAASTSHYCDQRCSKPDGTYFQVRCLCTTVNGTEVVQSHSCGTGCDTGKLILPNSTVLQK